MAKLVGPLFSTEARGRLGGVIYNTFRGKSTAKAFKSPCQPRSILQLAARALMTMVVRAWGLLQPEERLTWTNYAVAHTLPDWTGQPKRLTGCNWFAGCTTILSRLGIAQVDNAPTVSGPDAPEAFEAATGVLESDLSWTAGGPASSVVEIRAVGPHSPGRSPSGINAKLISNVDGELGVYTADDLIVGTYTFFARRVSTVNGLVSGWVSASAAITAT